MIDETNTSTTPRWLRTAACIAVTCVLPLGLIYCGQPDTPAVPDGEVTEAPPVEGNDAAQAGDSDDASQTRGMARVNQLRRDLRARVAAGEITEEQMRQRVSRALQRLEAAGGETASDRASSDEASGGDGTERLNQLRRELRAQVEAGEITEEQARQRASRALQRPGVARSGSGNR